MTEKSDQIILKRTSFDSVFDDDVIFHVCQTELACLLIVAR